MAKNRKEEQKIIGRVFVSNDRYYFQSKDGEIWDIKQNDLAKRLAYSEELCIFTVSKDKAPSASIVGEITDVMGRAGDPLPEGLAIATVHNLTNPFSHSALRQAEAMPSTVTKEQFEGFRDLRDIPFVTIDPDRAKDFDDAVFAEKHEDGSYTLRVAIANVANYIDRGSPLHNEIMKRGLSSYLGSTVYPMLPENISNVLCSINEKEDRVVMVTTSRINPDGTLRSYSVEPAVIKSRHRLTYKEADYIALGHCDVVEDQSVFSGLTARTIGVKPSIDALFELSDILANERKRRGALDVTSFRPHFVLDTDGTHVIGVEEEQAEESTKVIESTAILTNEIWGEVFQKLGLPAIYRNHSLPDEFASAMLSDKLTNFGLGLPQSPSAESYIQLLKSVKGRSIEEPVTSLVLKSFKEAYYCNENDGHFGLGIRPNDIFDYFHTKRSKSSDVADRARARYFKQTGSHNGLAFEGDISHSAYIYSTSPIRDGASYTVQSQLLDYIMTGRVKYDKDTLGYFASEFTDRQRNADLAEKEYNAMLGTVWAKDNIGSVVSGRIVNFYPDGILLKTISPKNISITLPREEIRSVHMSQAAMDSMCEKAGNRRKPSNRKKLGAKNRSPLFFGDVMDNLLIYAFSKNPSRVWVTEDMDKTLIDEIEDTREM